VSFRVPQNVLREKGGGLHDLRLVSFRQGVGLEIIGPDMDVRVDPIAALGVRSELAHGAGNTRQAFMKKLAAAIGRHVPDLNSYYGLCKNMA
jgi:hypothetical protein